MVCGDLEVDAVDPDSQFSGRNLILTLEAATLCILPTHGDDVAAVDDILGESLTPNGAMPGRLVFEQPCWDPLGVMISIKMAFI